MRGGDAQPEKLLELIAGDACGEVAYIHAARSILRLRCECRHHQCRQLGRWHHHAGHQPRNMARERSANAARKHRTLLLLDDLETLLLLEAEQRNEIGGGHAIGHGDLTHSHPISAANHWYLRIHPRSPDLRPPGSSRPQRQRVVVEEGNLREFCFLFFSFVFRTRKKQLSNWREL